MKVSVITPAYNAAATIAQAVASIQEQTTPDWEILIVDDGSSDGTGLIAKDLAAHDGRIRVITQANGGESAARNAGIVEARFEWILFLDADDWVGPGHLERLLSAVDVDPTLDAVHCGWARVAQNGVEVIEDYRPPAGDLFPVLALRAIFPVHACLVRRSVVEAAGCFDVSMRKSPDWDLWQRIARCGANFGSVPEVLAYYRMAPHSASMDAEQMLREGLRVLRRGHEADPRVRNPLPQYANGLTNSSVASQQYYLLSWCAGLLLGSGENAERLLTLVNGEQYPSLYANAIAQCIFDSAPLPSCVARQDWEGIWPRISAPTAAFLRALELQTHTPQLADNALRELKKLVIRNSPVWSDVIHHEEAAASALQDSISKMSEGGAWLAADRDAWRSRAEEWERKGTAMAENLAAAERSQAELAAETAKVQAELHGSRGRVEQLTVANEKTKQELAGAEERTNARTAQLQTALKMKEALEQRLQGLQLELTSAHARMDELEQYSRKRNEEMEQRRQGLEAALSSADARINELERYSQKRDEEMEQRRRGLEMALSSADARIDELVSYSESIALDLAAARARGEELEQQVKHVSGELAKWRESATARARLVEDLQQDAWMRLGMRLRTTKRRESAPATSELSPAPQAASGAEALADPAIEARWHLRVADGNEATLIYPREDHEMVRIGITKAGTKTNWDIQLNHLGLKVAGGVRYTVAFRARAQRPREIGVGFAKSHDPWTTLGMYTHVHLTQEWQTFHEEFAASEDDDDARIHFDLGSRAIGVDLTSVSFRESEQTLEAIEAHTGPDRDAKDGRVR